MTRLLKARPFLAAVRPSMGLPSAMATGNIPESDFRVSLVPKDDEGKTKLPTNLQQTYSSVSEKSTCCFSPLGFWTSLLLQHNLDYPD